MSKSTASADKAKELHEQLKAGVASLVSSDDWKTALDVAARFHRYSFNNTLLILMQRPDATRVAGYRTWHELGRQVRKGERGIRILAPCVAKKDDPDNPGEQRTVLIGFRSTSVFDVAQTDGQELPDVAPTVLTGDGVEGLWGALAAQIKAEGYTAAYVGQDALGQANGATNPDTRTVTIRDDLDLAQATKTLAHELAHVLLHPSLHEYRQARARCEVEAESVAYIVCQASGLASADYSLPYVAGWSGGQASAVTETGERVIRTARRILDALNSGTLREAA